MASRYGAICNIHYYNIQLQQATRERHDFTHVQVTGTEFSGTPAKPVEVRPNVDFEWRQMVRDSASRCRVVCLLKIELRICMGQI